MDGATRQTAPTSGAIYKMRMIKYYPLPSPPPLFSLGGAQFHP